MMSIRYLEKTITALHHYFEHCAQNIEAARRNGNEREAKDWEEVRLTYKEMIQSYTTCLNQQKNQLNDSSGNN